jgi:5-oxoprolinase (ATP-hydrolysing)
MNNLTFGDNSIGYYETIAGGAGAGPTFDGASAVQVHMTNTRITGTKILAIGFPRSIPHSCSYVFFFF